MNLNKSKNQPAREGGKWRMDCTATRFRPEAATVELQRKCLEEKKICPKPSKWALKRGSMMVQNIKIGPNGSYLKSGYVIRFSLQITVNLQLF
jgi:hypothetical protein